MAKLPDQLIAEEVITEIVAGTVRETIKQLRKSGMMRSWNDGAYQEIGSRLASYYRGTEDKEMDAALDRLAAEEPDYFGILPEYYREKTKIEDIGPLIGCDRSTVLRQKKRLCLRLFQLLQ